MSATADREEYGVPPWHELLSHDIRFNFLNRCFRCGRTARDIMATNEIRDIEPGDGYGRPT